MRALPIAACAVALLSVSGCGENIKERLGLAAPSPDEYRVTSHAPLAVPPEFELKPPAPGAQPLTMIQSGDTAQAIITGKDPNAQIREGAVANPSQGEAKLLEKAGAAQAVPTIREELTREAIEKPKEKKKQGWFGRLIGRKEEDEADKEPLQEIKAKPKVEIEGASPAGEPKPSAVPVPAQLPEPSAKP